MPAKAEAAPPRRRNKPKETPATSSGSIEAADSPASDPSKPRRSARSQQKQNKKPASGGEASSSSSQTPSTSKSRHPRKKKEKPAAAASASKKDSSRPAKNKKKTPAPAAAAEATSTTNTNKASVKKKKERVLYEEYVGLDALVSGLESGELFRTKIRCNPGDRTQGFGTIPGLPHDVFIPGWKAQNRAIEGDEVVIEFLPIDQWRVHQARTSRKDNSSNSKQATPTSFTAPVPGNVVPFSPTESSTAFEEGEEFEPEEFEGLTPAASVRDDLVASPAMFTSPSGGELPVMLEQAPLGLSGTITEEIEEEIDPDLSMVGFVAQKLEEATLSSPSDEKKKELNVELPWSGAATPSAVIQIIAGLLNNTYQGYRATAKVVGIMNRSDRRNTVVGVLKHYTKHALNLIPRDQRLPSCVVAISGLKQVFGNEKAHALVDEANRNDLPSRTMVSARIVEWEITHRLPKVDVVSILGQAGGLDVEISALLTQEHIKDDDQFTPAVLECLPAVPWSISPADVAERRDLRKWRIYSIDPPTARDLDDALSVERLSNGLLRIGVHIADVSHFVQPGSALDNEAAERSTSVYLVDRVIPMLPRLLCEELCSLNPGVDRLSFSIIWDMTDDGTIKETWAGRTIICSCGKLSYPQVQELIDGNTTPEGRLPEGIAIHGNQSWKDVAEDALLLHSVAMKMRRRRFEEFGALRLDNARLFFELDESGRAIEYGIYQVREANRLVEEFMLAANMTAAKMISDAFPDRALLRRHMPPNATKMRELAANVAKLLPDAPKLDVSSAGALQKSLQDLKSSVGAEIAEVVTLLCTKPMQTAQYFCTGDQEDPSLWRHYALAVGHYTHFTSPIRRYPDVLVHRLLAATLERQKSNQLFDTDQVSEIAIHANERKTAAKAAQDGALKLYLASLLIDRPQIFSAIIVGLGGSKFFDAYVPALGIDVRVHTDKILRGGEKVLNLEWNNEEQVLSISMKSLINNNNKDPNLCVPPYEENIENFDKLHNPNGIQTIGLPLILKPLSAIPLVVHGARSKTSGSPVGISAQLYIK